MKLLGRANIFSVPIFEYEISDYKTLNKNLLHDALKWQQDADGVNMSNEGGSWHSPVSLFQRDEESFRTLCKNIFAVVSDFVRTINPNFDFDAHNVSANGWVNINKSFAFNSLHNHGEFHLSGCYYVAQPKVSNGKSGMIEFVNSRNDDSLSRVIGGVEFAKKIQKRPSEGTMLVFPATVMHSVYPNETNDLRVSIAWNVLFQKK